jgi:ABC-type phosphate transport system substrate-binding protein
MAVCFASQAQAEDFVVVRNAKSGGGTVSKADLRGAFTGKVREFSGNAVVVVLQSEANPAFQWLADSIFGVAPKMLASKIKQEVFKGDMNKPVSAETDADVIAKIKESPGGIGVVSAAAAKDPALAIVTIGS